MLENKLKHDEWLALGTCRRPHGIKGAFDFKLENTQDSALAEKMDILLKPLSSKSRLSREGEIFKIKKIVFGHKVMAYLEGVNNRNDVEALLPFEIFMRKCDLPETEEGEFYLSDLKGLVVYANNEEFGLEQILSSRSVGKVERIDDNGASPILTIGRGSDSFQVPFVEAFVPHVDIEAGVLVVNIPSFIE